MHSVRSTEVERTVTRGETKVGGVAMALLGGGQWHWPKHTSLVGVRCRAEGWKGNGVTDRLGVVKTASDIREATKVLGSLHTRLLGAMMVIASNRTLISETLLVSPLWMSR